MRILSLNAKDMGGGAANAGYRLHKGLNSIGVDSELFVRENNREDENIISPNRFYSKHNFRNHLDMLPIRHRKEGSFSLNWIPDRVQKVIQSSNPDILHLHWIAGGFMYLRNLKDISRPVVWTLHDMWPFTGGCHYPRSCERFKNNCGQCPQLNSEQQNDISSRRQTLKETIIDESEIRFIAPCEWMAKMATSSSIIGDSMVEVIPNGIDTSFYKPQLEVVGYEEFGLDNNKNHLLFVSDLSKDSRKGGQFVHSLEKYLSQSFLNDTVLVTLGTSEGYNSFEHLPVKSLGYLDEESLSLLYSTVDATIIPTVTDNFPCTTMESMAAGTPCVVFPTGGLPEMVDHNENGYITEEATSSSLATGIQWMLSNPNRLEELSFRARQKAEAEYGIEKVAHTHMSLYESLL